MNDDLGKELEERAKTIENQNMNKAVLLGGEQDEILDGVISSIND